MKKKVKSIIAILAFIIVFEVGQGSGSKSLEDAELEGLFDE